MSERQQLREESARKDRERLQGAWTYFSGQREANLLVSGDHFTLQFRNGDIYVGTYALDPTNRPRAIDMVVAEGPEEHRGRTALAIYEFDGEHLIWSPAPPGHAERPRAFPPSDDPAHLCIVFRKQPRSGHVPVARMK